MKKVIIFCLLAIFLFHGSAFGSFNFIDNGNGTVTDARTGLVWLKNASAFSYMNWVWAVDQCRRLANGQAGLTDGSVAGQWRLPSKEELEGVGTDPPATWYGGYPTVPWTMPGAPFIGVQGAVGYWSGTSAAWLSSTDGAYYMDLGNGRVGIEAKSVHFFYYSWPVRGYVPVTTTSTAIPITTTTTMPISTTSTVITSTTTTTISATTTTVLPTTSSTTSSIIPTTTTISSTTTTPPTIIDLASFEAIAGNSSVSLSWETESEIDNAGFNLYRSDSENGEYIKINDSLIPTEGTTTQGASYEFIDTDVKNRKTYYYKLEDIDLNGTSTMHGAVSAMPRWIYGIGK